MSIETTSSLALRIVPVNGWLDALRMRSIRNECRLFMTQDQSHIGYLQQWRFWRSLGGRKDLEAVLAWDGKEAVGYGLVSLRDGTWWVSGGLTVNQRGRGYGKLLFGYLTSRARLLGEDSVFLEVLRDNEPARETYRSLGYREIGRAGNVITMVYP